MKERQEIIICNAGNDVVVWKSDVEDFGYNTEVVVPYSHEAVFVKDGEALETLPGGRYTLNEKSTSFFANLFKKKETRFSCKIYFINKTVNLKIRWGTASPLNLIDAMLEIPVRVGAHGEFEIRVENTRKFLMKVVGNTAGVTAAGLQEYFREQLMLYIKDAIAAAMVTNKVGFYEADTQLRPLSAAIHTDLKDVFAGYGVALENFILSGISIPEEVKTMLEQEYYQRKKLQLRDTSYREERAAAKDALKIVLDTAAQGKKKGKFCGECGSEIPAGSKFCNVCGKSVTLEAMRCPACGGTVTAGSKFCNNCGKKL